MCAKQEGKSGKSDRVGQIRLNVKLFTNAFFFYMFKQVKTTGIAGQSGEKWARIL